MTHTWHIPTLYISQDILRLSLAKNGNFDIILCAFVRVSARENSVRYWRAVWSGILCACITTCVCVHRQRASNVTELTSRVCVFNINKTIKCLNLPRLAEKVRYPLRIPHNKKSRNGIFFSWQFLCQLLLKAHSALNTVVPHFRFNVITAA